MACARRIGVRQMTSRDVPEASTEASAGPFEDFPDGLKQGAGTWNPRSRDTAEGLTRKTNPERGRFQKKSYHKGAKSPCDEQQPCEGTHVPSQQLTWSLTFRAPLRTFPAEARRFHAQTGSSPSARRASAARGASGGPGLTQRAAKPQRQTSNPWDKTWAPKSRGSTTFLLGPPKVGAQQLFLLGPPKVGAQQLFTWAPKSRGSTTFFTWAPKSRGSTTFFTWAPQQLVSLGPPKDGAQQLFLPGPPKVGAQQLFLLGPPKSRGSTCFFTWAPKSRGSTTFYLGPQKSGLNNFFYLGSQKSGLNNLFYLGPQKSGLNNFFYLGPPKSRGSTTFTWAHKSRGLNNCF